MGDGTKEVDKEMVYHYLYINITTDNCQEAA